MEHDASQIATKPRSLRNMIAVTLAAALLLGAMTFFAQQPPRASHAAPDLIGWQSQFRSIYGDGNRGNMHAMPVLMVFTADYCPPCQFMKKNVYADADIAALIHDNFLAIKVDLSQPGPEEYALSRKHKVEYLPTIIVLDQAEQEIVRANTLNADRMTRLLNAALRHVESNPPRLSQRHDSGNYPH